MIEEDAFEVTAQTDVRCDVTQEIISAGSQAWMLGSMVFSSKKVLDEWVVSKTVQLLGGRPDDAEVAVPAPSTQGVARLPPRRRMPRRPKGS